MNSSASGDSGRDSIVCFVAALVLLIGTAIDNAIVMVILSLASLAGLILFYRGRLTGNAFWAAMTGAVLAAVTAAAIVYALR